MLPAHADSGTRSRADARSLAQEFFDRLDAHDLEGASSLVASDAKVDLEPARITGVFERHGAYYFESLIESFPDAKMQIRSITGNAATAVVETTLRGTQAADFLGIRDRRRELHIDQAWVVSASQGRIDGIRGYWCQCQLYRRLGQTRLDDDAPPAVPGE